MIYQEFHAIFNTGFEIEYVNQYSNLSLTSRQYIFSTRLYMVQNNVSYNYTIAIKANSGNTENRFIFNCENRV